MSENMTEMSVNPAMPEETYIDAGEKNAAAGLCGGGDSSCGEAPSGERLFSQREVDDLIRERLRRERKNNDALRDTKGLIDRLRGEGIICAESYSDASEEIARLISSAQTGKDKADADTLEDFGGFSEVLEDVSSEQEAEEGVTPEGSGNSLEGRLSALYEKFCGILEGLSSDEREDKKSGALRSFSSTGFSRSSVGAVFDTEINLSPTQRRIAREAGIPYREYASLLRDIPDREYLKRNLK